MPETLPKTLHLPSEQQVLLDQLLRNEKNIRILHPLLDLLEKPNPEASGLVKALIKILEEVSEDLQMSQVQQARSQEQATRLEQKLDRILDVLNLPIE